ncbi:MAG: hypothetical protein ACFFBP_11490 [Promethearchaeota archaeon]
MRIIDEIKENYKKGTCNIRLLHNLLATYWIIISYIQDIIRFKII